MIGQVESAAPSARSRACEPWDATRFFDLLQSLGRLRVISQSGPSTFEALCTVEAFEIERGFVNAITSSYHWHLATKRFRHLRSHDEIHGRSGRRVLYFALREERDSPPFLRIYMHREPGAEFEPEREAVFAAAHEDLADGADLARDDA